MYVYIYIYICVYRERERDRERDKERDRERERERDSLGGGSTHELPLEELTQLDRLTRKHRILLASMLYIRHTLLLNNMYVCVYYIYIYIYIYKINNSSIRIQT